MLKKHLISCLLVIAFMQKTTAQVNTFESFDGVKIAYTDEGYGEPILLLHGFLNSRKSWDNTVLKQQLINTGYRVIIPDLRGNGDSDKPKDEGAYGNGAEIKDWCY